MELRYQPSDPKRVQVGLALNPPSQNIPKQAHHPTATPSSESAKKGNTSSDQKDGEAGAGTDADSHKRGQPTDVAAGPSDDVQKKRSATSNVQPVDTTSSDFPYSMGDWRTSRTVKSGDSISKSSMANIQIRAQGKTEITEA
ncbi:hypothetical protein ACJ72_03788 [Emergomyces africanus]|uniref:Uncharacterized protein n=1 Tax=Emergomyces africanus TaxID=1955775 RepID=A0A1B7NYN7_9EURO|nr:hypothetical protein ACJ72_03788 [Emergomyces africanus]